MHIKNELLYFLVICNMFLDRKYWLRLAELLYLLIFHLNLELKEKTQ